jgi:hypothetical protein
MTMAKQLKDILAGTKSSKVVPGSTGTKPAVDYDPKSEGDRKFVEKHKTEKFDDRVGNKDDVYQATNVKKKSNKITNKGYNKGEDEKVYEEKKPEENAMCNESPKGVKCPVHGMTECMSAKKINETEQVDEVLTKNTSVGEFIKDFQNSKNKKFKGKSPEKRRQMAVAAHYALQKEDLAMPLLGSADDTGIKMIKAELKAISDKSNNMCRQMPDSMHVEPWVQAKIATAKELISSVHDYMIYGDHDKNDDEGTETPMTFPGMNVDNALGMNV